MKLHEDDLMIITRDTHNNKVYITNKLSGIKCWLIGNTDGYFITEVIERLNSDQIENERKDCLFHSEEANKFCTDPDTHHLLKYHNPQSEYYIGEDCVNCIGSYLEKRWMNHYIQQAEE